MTTKHTFVLCAYGESPYLEECILSLKAQTVTSEILLSTATPNELIRSLAEKYSLPLFINEGEKGISADWNFALRQAKTPFVTVAHQDDIYEPTYAACVIALMEKKNTVLAFSDYFEIRNGARVYKNKLLSTKRKMNALLGAFPRCRFVRRRVLSLGNAICCPAVTYRTSIFETFSFDKKYRFVCDWDAWERLSRLKGAFRYHKEALVGHRIHEDSATTALTNSSRRAEEEREMFARFHPAPIVRLLMRSYAKGAQSNTLEKEDIHEKK